jgi:hypothetical protein
MVIVGALMGVAVVSIRSMDSTNLRSGARHVATTLRFAHDRARSTGKDHRVIFDLSAEGGTKISFEVAKKGKKLLPRTLDEAWDQQRQFDAGEEAEAAKRAAETTTLGGLSKDLLGARPDTGPQWTKVKLRTKHAENQLLRAGRYVSSIYLPRLGEEVSQGKLALHVWSGGRLERAAIYLKDGEGQTYTLITFPLTGRVMVYDARIELRRDAFRKDDLGEVIKEQ